MSVVYFYKGDVGKTPDEIKGTIDLLASFVHEDAAVQWDRFLELNDASAPSHDLRFVQVGGVWRAFHALFGDFIAEWNGKEWTTKRTTARKHGTVNIPGVGIVHPIHGIPTSGDISDEEFVMAVDAGARGPGVLARHNKKTGVVTVVADAEMPNGPDPGSLTALVAKARERGTLAHQEIEAAFTQDVVPPRKRGICGFCGSDDGMLCECYR